MVGMALVLGTACEGDPEVPRGPIVSDSAGLRIVRNPAAWLAAVPRWKVDPAPLLDIGEVAGDEALQFSGVAGVVRFPDGEVAVLDRGSSELRLYSPDGTPVWQVGGEGDGPGEFRYGDGLWPLGADSLAVWDGQLRRVTVFHRSGELARSFEMPSAVARPDVVGIAGGALVVVSEDREGDPARRTIRHLRVGLDGQVLDTLAFHDVGVIPVVDGMLALVQVFSYGPLQAARGSSLWVGMNASLEVEGIPLSGPGPALVRWAGTLQRVTARDREQHAELQLIVSDGEARRQEVVAGLERLPVAEFHSPYQALMADDAGRLWVREGDRFLQPETSLWWVFDAGGAMAATIELPHGFSIHQVEGDLLVGVEVDDLGVERVRVYGLVRTNPDTRPDTPPLADDLTEGRD